MWCEECDEAEPDEDADELLIPLPFRSGRSGRIESALVEFRQGSSSRFIRGAAAKELAGVFFGLFEGNESEIGKKGPSVTPFANSV